MVALSSLNFNPAILESSQVRRPIERPASRGNRRLREADKDEIRNRVGISISPRFHAAAASAISLMGIVQFLSQRTIPFVAARTVSLPGPISKWWPLEVSLDSDFAWALLCSAAWLVGLSSAFSWLRASIKEGQIKNSY